MKIINLKLTNCETIQSVRKYNLISCEQKKIKNLSFVAFDFNDKSTVCIGVLGLDFSLVNIRELQKS